MKKIKTQAFGILNMYGDFWTHKAFESEEDAQEYMDKWIAAYSTPEKFEKHKIIPVLITPLKHKTKN